MSTDDFKYGTSPHRKQYNQTTRPGSTSGLVSDYGRGGNSSYMKTIAEDQMDEYYQPDRETRAGAGSQMSRNYSGIENDKNAHN